VVATQQKWALAIAHLPLAQPQLKQLYEIFNPRANFEFEILVVTNRKIENFNQNIIQITDN
jgi:hypothetical protein